MFDKHLLPIDILAFKVSVFWHERIDDDPAIDWMRHQLFELFSENTRRSARV